MVWELLSKLPTVSHGIEPLKPIGDGFRPCRFVAMSDISIPSAESPDHPRKAGETSSRMRVFLLGRCSFELVDQRLYQGFISLIECVGKPLTRRAITRHDELHDTERCDQCCSCELDHGVGVENLALFETKALGFQCPEHLLDDPTTTIEGDDAFGIDQALDRMGRQKPPDNRLFAFGWINLTRYNKPQLHTLRPGLWLVPGSCDRDRAKADGKLGFACRPAAWTRRHIDGSARDNRKCIGGLEQKAPAQQRTVLTGANEQVHVIRARRDQLGVKIAFAIGNHGHLPSRGEHVACRTKTIKPALRFFLAHRALAAMLAHRSTSIDRDGFSKPEDAAAVGRNHHDRMQEQAYVDPVSDLAKSPLAAVMLREVQFCRVLDRQDVPALGSARGVSGGGRDHFLGRDRTIVQKAAKPHLLASFTAKPADARRPLIDQRCEEISAPFFSRSSPNDLDRASHPWAALQNQPPIWNHCSPTTASMRESNVCTR
jgi:hypothetical protein